jgi:sugar lactone lactonase YvrE
VRAAAVDPAGNLWVSFVQPYTYVYNPDGEKIRVVQFYGAGIIRPSGLFFAGPGQVLVAPGCYIFDVPR